MGYALYRDRTGRATELRQLVARVVAADEAGLYTQDFLGRPNAEYCEWIQYSDSWGGAIELSILSAALGVCIYSGDSQTTRVDSYGADESGFTERVLVLYDGVHYDALALAPSAGADEAFDETVLRRDAPSAAAVDAALATLLAAAQAGRRFTDTSAFTLRCLVCRFPLRGQAAAAEHAQATGHTAFGEY